MVVALTLTTPMSHARSAARLARIAGDVRRELRGLRDHGYIDVADAPAVGRGERADMAEQHAAVGALPARVGIGKVLAKVAQRQRAEDRVADRVQEDVGVGVAVESALVRDLHATQHETATGDERVHVEAIADPQGGHWSTFALRAPVFALGAARRGHWSTPSRFALRVFALGRPGGLMS